VFSLSFEGSPDAGVPPLRPPEETERRDEQPDNTARQQQTRFASNFRWFGATVRANRAMKRVAPLLCSVLLLTTGSVAEDAPAVAAGNPSVAPVQNPIVAPQPAGDKGAEFVIRPRAVSPATAAMLAAAAPRFQPVAAPAQPTHESVEEVPDKPRNGIVRLPRYIVREPRVPALSEYQVLTPKGKVELALKTYPGLRFGSFWIFRNDGIALAMLEEDVAAERARELAELTSLLPTNGPSPDSEQGRKQRLIRDALTPRSSWTNMSTGGTSR
jgi:hypothetical protein